jgi:hypothetical protein
VSRGTGDGRGLTAPAAGPGQDQAGEPAQDPTGEPGRDAPAPGRKPRVSSEARNAAVRATLEPLGEHERPTSLLISVAVAALLATAIAVGAATVHDLSRHGGSLPGAVFLTAVLALLAVGMYQRRYGAVLGFEALLAFQILVTALAMVVATTILAALLCLVAIVLSGWLFWKLIRVMGRIQAGEQPAE